MHGTERTRHREGRKAITVEVDRGDGLCDFARRYVSSEIPEYSPVFVIWSTPQPREEGPEVAERVGLANAKFDKRSVRVRIIDQPLVDILVAGRARASGQRHEDLIRRPK
jgi:hypothetical protein